MAFTGSPLCDLGFPARFLDHCVASLCTASVHAQSLHLYFCHRLLGRCRQPGFGSVGLDGVAVVAGCGTARKDFSGVFLCGAAIAFWRGVSQWRSAYIDGGLSANVGQELLRQVLSFGQKASVAWQPGFQYHRMLSWIGGVLFIPCFG